MGEKSLPAKVDELMTELVNKDPLVLASISAVPYFGSTLTTFFSAKWLTIYQERTKALFDRFGKDLSELDEHSIKKDYFDTDEGIDLLIKATEQSANTRSEEKRNLIARILCGAVLDREVGEYSPEEYLNLLSDLTPIELILARSLYEARPEVGSEEEWNIWEKEIRAKTGIDAPVLRMALSRLNSIGLLQQVSSGIDDVGFWIDQPEYGGSGFYIVTPTFDKVMKFLQLEK
ncbi:hypothetical protein BH23ACT11_BH23ACT11_26290 [soil metagenome]